MLKMNQNGSVAHLAPAQTYLQEDALAGYCKQPTHALENSKMGLHPIAPLLTQLVSNIDRKGRREVISLLLWRDEC